MEKDQNKIKDIIKSTGLLINEKRLEQGLSLEALSQKCGVTVHDPARLNIQRMRLSGKCFAARNISQFAIGVCYPSCHHPVRQNVQQGAVERSFIMPLGTSASLQLAFAIHLAITPARLNIQCVWLSGKCFAARNISQFATGVCYPSCHHLLSL